MSDLDNAVRKYSPKNPLDYNMLVTDTMWGSEQISDDLKSKLKKFTGRVRKFEIYNKERKETYDFFGEQLPEEVKNNPNKYSFQVLEVDKYADMWGLLGFYTRDLRLANLSVNLGEIAYCQYFLDLAGDYLQAGFVEPFVVCLSRVATILELSQSKGGFLRRNMNTLRTEMSSEEVPKRNLFGSKVSKS